MKSLSKLLLMLLFIVSALYGKQTVLMEINSEKGLEVGNYIVESQNTVNMIKIINSVDNIEDLIYSKAYTDQSNLSKENLEWVNFSENGDYLVIEKNADNFDLTAIEEFEIKKEDERYFDAVLPVEPVLSSEYNDDQFILNWEENFERKYPIYYSEQKYMIRIQKGLPPLEYDFNSTDAQIKEISADEDFNEFLDNNMYADIIFDKGSMSINYNEVAVVILPNQFKIISLKPGLYYYQFYTIKSGYQSNGSPYKIISSVEGDDFLIGETTVANIRQNNVFSPELVNAAKFGEIGLYFATKSNKEIEMKKENVVELKEKNLTSNEGPVVIDDDDYTVSESNLTKIDKRFPLDIVFAIDRSGSMGDEIADVKDNILAFTSSLEDKGFDVKYGMVSFCYGSDILVDDNAGNTISYSGQATNSMTSWNGSTRLSGNVYYLKDKKSGDLYGGYNYRSAKYYYNNNYSKWYDFYYLKEIVDYSYREKIGEGTYFESAESFKEYLTSVPVNGGADGNEMAWDAVAYAINNYPKRENADKMVVLVTDFGTHFDGERRGVSNTTSYEQTVYRAVNNSDPSLSISHLVENNVIDLNIICPDKEDWRYYSNYYEDYKNGLDQYYSVVNAGFGNLYNIATDMQAVLNEIINNVDKIRRWKITYQTAFSDKDGTEREVSFKLQNVKNELDEYINFTTDGIDEIGEANYTAPKSLGTILNKNFVNENYIDIAGADDFDSLLSYRDKYGDYGKITGSKTDLMYRGVVPEDDIFLIYKREAEKVKWETVLPGTEVDEDEGDVIADTSSIDGLYDYFITVYPDKSNPASQIFGKVFDGFSTPLIYNNLSIEILKNNTIGEVSLKISGEIKEEIVAKQLSLGIFKVGEGISGHDFSQDMIISEDDLIELDETNFILKDKIIIPEDYVEFEIRLYRDFKKSLASEPVKMLVAIDSGERGISLELYSGIREENLLINSSLLEEEIDLKSINRIDDDKNSIIEAVKVLNTSSFSDIEELKAVDEQYFGKAVTDAGEKWYSHDESITGKMLIINKSNIESLDSESAKNGAGKLEIKDKNDNILIKEYYPLSYIYKEKYVSDDIASFIWTKVEENDNYDEEISFKNAKIMFRLTKADNSSSPESLEDLNYRYNVYERENTKNTATVENLKDFVSDSSTVNYVDFEFDYYSGDELIFELEDHNIELNLYRGLFQVKGLENGDYQIQAYSINESKDNILKIINFEFAENFEIKKASYTEIAALNYPRVTITPKVNNRLAAPTWITDDTDPSSQERILEPSVIINKTAYAEVNVQGGGLIEDGNDYQFVKDGEDPKETEWKPLEGAGSNSIPSDMIEDKTGFTTRYFDVSHLPNLDSKELWEDRAQVFKYPSTDVVYKSGYTEVDSFDEIRDGDYLFFDTVRLDGWKEAFKSWGYIVPQESGEYYFATISDDGARGYIIIDGKPVWFSDSFSLQAPTFNTTNTPVSLKRGVAYPVYLEYMNWGGHGVIELLMRKGSEWPYADGTSVNEWNNETNQLEVKEEYRDLYTGENSYKVPDTWTHPTTNKTPGEDPEAIWLGSKIIDFPDELGRYSVYVKSENDSGNIREASYGIFEVADTFPEWSITEPNYNDEIVQVLKINEAGGTRIEGTAKKHETGTIDKVDIWISPNKKDSGETADIEWIKSNSLYNNSYEFDHNTLEDQDFEFNLSKDDVQKVKESGKKEFVLLAELSNETGDFEHEARKPLIIDSTPPKIGSINILNETTNAEFKKLTDDATAKSWSEIEYDLGGVGTEYPDDWKFDLDLPNGCQGYYSKKDDILKITAKIYDENPKDMEITGDFSLIDKNAVTEKLPNSKNEIKDSDVLIGYECIWEIKVEPKNVNVAAIEGRGSIKAKDSFGNEVTESFFISLADFGVPTVDALSKLDNGSYIENTIKANDRWINHKDLVNNLGFELSGSDTAIKIGEKTYDTGIRTFVVRYDYDWSKSDRARKNLGKPSDSSDKVSEKNVWIQKIAATDDKADFVIAKDDTNHSTDGEYDIKEIYAIDYSGNISKSSADINFGGLEDIVADTADNYNNDTTFYIDTIAPDIIETADYKAVFHKTQNKDSEVNIVLDNKVKDGDYGYFEYYTVDYNPTKIDTDYIYNKDSVFYPKLSYMGLSRDDTGTVIESRTDSVIIGGTDYPVSKVRAGKGVLAGEFKVVTDIVNDESPKSIQVYGGVDAAGNEASSDTSNLLTFSQSIDNKEIDVSNLTDKKVVPFEAKENSWGGVHSDIIWNTTDTKIPYTNSQTAYIIWKGDIEDLYAYKISANGVEDFKVAESIDDWGDYKIVEITADKGVIAPNSKSTVSLTVYDSSGNESTFLVGDIVNDNMLGMSIDLSGLDVQREEILSIYRDSDIGHYETKAFLSEIDDLAGIWKYSVFIKKVETDGTLTTLSGLSYFSKDHVNYVDNSQIIQTNESDTIVPAYQNGKELSDSTADKTLGFKQEDLKSGDIVRIELTVYDKMNNSFVFSQDYVLNIPSQDITIISTEEGKDKAIETKMKRDGINVFEVQEREENGITEDELPESLRED